MLFRCMYISIALVVGSIHMTAVGILRNHDVHSGVLRSSACLLLMLDFQEGFSLNLDRAMGYANIETVLPPSYSVLAFSISNLRRNAASSLILNGCRIAGCAAATQFQSGSRHPRPCCVSHY